jgi:hypothetical protein
MKMAGNLLCRPSFIESWCPEEDSNLHGVTRQYLKLVRLPIPPSGQERAILTEGVRLGKYETS